MSFSDIFKGPMNVSLDLARIAGAFVVIVAYPFPYAWNVLKHGIVPEPSAFGTGYAAVILAVAAFIGGKDLAVAKANATTVQAQGASQ